MCLDPKTVVECLKASMWKRVEEELNLLVKDLDDMEKLQEITGRVIKKMCVQCGEKIKASRAS